MGRPSLGTHANNADGRQGESSRNLAVLGDQAAVGGSGRELKAGVVVFRAERRKYHGREVAWSRNSQTTAPVTVKRRTSATIEMARALGKSWGRSMSPTNEGIKACPI